MRREYAVGAWVADRTNKIITGDSGHRAVPKYSREGPSLDASAAFAGWGGGSRECQCGMGGLCLHHFAARDFVSGTAFAHWTKGAGSQQRVRS